MKGLEIFEVPSKVFFGPRAISNVAQVLGSCNYRKILFLTGRVHSRKYAENVVESVDKMFDVEIVDHGDVVDVLNLYEKYRNRNVDVIVGIGGGKVIDVAKALAYLLEAPVVSVPTTASHDGISSPYVAYLLQLDLSEKLGVKRVYKVPKAILADTSIIKSAPRRYLLAGIGEILGKIVAVKDWELASRVKGEEFSEFAAKLSLSSYEIVVRNIEKLKIHNEESVRLVVKALIGCGVAMAIAGSSRPCSGSEHMFCHALDLLARERTFDPPLHGEVVALGALMMSYLHGLKWRKLRNIMRTLGLPVTARELGLDRDIIVEALLLAHRIRPDRYTILGSDGLTRRAAEQLIDVLGIA
ncbi:MAG: iron-containing alcohol dehydrogenase [Crenarchaeota archaeon]|nr:iron-containing alcohol dehydrogenase [Thermoproteota archaeon]